MTGISVTRLREPPPNCGEYFAEVSRGLTELYGPETGMEYLGRAPKMMQAGMAHPMVDTLAAMDGHAAAGMLMAVAEEDAGRIAFLHVLEAYAGRGIEARLVKEAVRTLRAGGLEGIVSEYLPCCALDLDTTYESLGFDRIERALMIAPLDGAPLACGKARATTPCRPEDQEGLAEAIEASYRDHPERALHLDVRSRERAAAFIVKAEEGRYGGTDAEFLRIIRSEGRVAGGLCGCVAAPGVGFVLQVVVHPDFQGQGLGTQLLRETAEAFRCAGLTRVALGVTTTNPAYRLYERLGFEVIRGVDTYVWWRA